MPVEVRRSRRRDGAVALSLANLLCLPVWSAVLPRLAPGNQFLLAAPAHPWWFLGAISIVLTLALLLYGSAELRTRSRAARRLSEVALVLAVVLVAAFARLHVPALHLATPGGVLRVVGCALLGLVAARAGRFLFGTVTAAIYVALLAASPFAGVTTGRCLLAVATYDPHPAAFAVPHAPPLAARPGGRRLIVVVFDELDYETVFVHRPPGLELPELDRLRLHSWSAEEVFPAVNGTTGSIPAMLSGEAVSAYDVSGPATLGLAVRGHVTDWRGLRSIFGAARTLGVRSAIIGWYLPYCRIFGSVVDACTATTYVHEPDNAAESLFLLGRALAIRTPVLRRFLADDSGWVEVVPASTTEKKHRAALTFVRNGALNAVRRHDLGLVYAHFPVPHLPPIHDRRRSAETEGYLENLLLADESLGELRLALGASGSTRDTALLVTSDHSFRGYFREAKPSRVDTGNPSHRVPLMLQLPAEPGAAAFREPLSLTVVHDLAVAYLGGEIETYADASQIASERALDR